MNPENTPTSQDIAPSTAPVSTPPVQEQQASSQLPKKSSNKMIIILIIAVVVILVAAVGGWFVMNTKNSSSEPTPAPVVEDINTEAEQATTASGSGLLDESSYVDTSAGFEIKSPIGWTTQKNPVAGVLVMFVNPNSPGTSINVVSAPSEGLSLDEYVDLNKEQLKGVLANYVAGEEESVIVNGEKGYIISGTFGNPKVKNKQLFIVSGDKAYVITATSTEAGWNENLPGFDASLKSFVVSN